YVLGGTDETSAPQSTTYYAKLNPDGSIGSWSTTSALPVAISGQTSVVSNGYAYIIGGFVSNPVQTVYLAKLNSDGTVGAWQQSNASLPAPRVFGASVAANGYVYYIGGRNPNVQGSEQTTVYYASFARTYFATNLDLIGLG